MEISESNMLLEAAKSGNFAAFCVFSMLEGIDLEKISDFEEFYEKIRKKLPEHDKTQNSTWFSLQEFFDFYHSHLSSSEPLFEVASAQSRIRMRRAAKRTSRIRARKRAIRERFRKNKIQLAKRAYNQVKTELRKRLTGGKPWSDVSLSTRQRIDSMIAKRKPLMKRLVKQRIQKMPTQESQRLKAYAIRMREDFDYSDTEYVSESNKDKTGTERKRRFDQRNKIDRARFIKRVKIVKSKKTGKTMLIDRDSLTKDHILREETVSDISAVCKGAESGNINFDQTPTSKQICGEMKMEKEKTKSKSTKSKDNNSSTSTPENKLPAPNTEQEIPKMPTKQYASAAQREYTMETLFNIQQENPDDYAKLQAQMTIYFDNLGALQNSDPSDPNATQSLDAVRNSRSEATSIFNKHKINEKVYSYFFDYSEEFIAGKNTVDELIQFPELRDKLLISLGSKGGKTDLLAVSRVSGNSESIRKELLELLESGGKDPKKTKRLDEILKQSIRISIKTGASQLMSGSLSTDETDGIQLLAYANAMSQSKNVEDAIKDFIEFAAENVTEVRTSGTQAEIEKKGNQEDKANLKGLVGTKRKLNELLDGIVNNPDVVKHVLRGALTGVHRFDEGNPFSRIAIATHFLTTDRNGVNVKFTEISDDFIESLASTKNKFYVAIKSASSETQEEAENTSKYKELLQHFFNNQNDENPDPKKISSEFLDKVYSIYQKVTKHAQTAYAQTEQPDMWKSLPYGELVDGYLKSEQYNSDSIEYDDIDRAILSKAIAPTMKARSMWLALRITMPTAKKSSKKSSKNKKELTKTEEKNFRFSHNPLIRMLLEINEILPSSIETKQKNETEKSTEHERKIYEILFKYAGTDLNKIMQLLDVSIDRISMDPIDVSRYLPSRGDGRYNSIYIDGKYHQVPLSVSERYYEIGKAFLQENKKRNYRSEYDNYHSTREQRKKRSRRNTARRWAERKGLVHKGDGKDVDHKNGNPMDNSPGNLRVRDRGANRADNE